MSGEIRANNILISDGPHFRRVAMGQAEIQFGVMWENSWHFRQYDPRLNLDVTNWDAAWIFAKYSLAGGPWLHMYLDLNANNHRVTQSNASVAVKVGTSMVEGVERGMGVFIHRDQIGMGTLEVRTAFLRWNYGQFGVDSHTADDDLRIRLFAIEMVYIPAGAFFMGDCAFVGRALAPGERAQSVSYLSVFNLDGDIVTATAANCPVPSAISPITSEDPSLTFRGEPIHPDFPRGFRSFYIMKHPITQAAWVDFLNTLTFAQQQRRTVNGNPAAAVNTAAMGGTAANRNWVRIRTPGVAATGIPAVYGHNGAPGGTAWDRNSNGGNIAMNFLSIFDGLAYADWAGLRPMTEMEFEKASRGPVQPRTGEFVWGGRIPTNGINMQHEWGSRETMAGNFRPIAGNPIRVGAFAHYWTNREQAGATLFGVMNMSDNVWERVISLTDGSTFFTGVHGDGILAVNGDANIESWPEPSAAGFQRGGWGTRGNQTSNRTHGELTRNAAGAVITAVGNPELPTALRPAGLSHFGFRAVRTAP